jgi:hypothetical protein
MAESAKQRRCHAGIVIPKKLGVDKDPNEDSGAGLWLCPFFLLLFFCYSFAFLVRMSPSIHAIFGGHRQ